MVLAALRMVVVPAGPLIAAARVVAEAHCPYGVAAGLLLETAFTAALVVMSAARGRAAALGRPRPVDFGAAAGLTATALPRGRRALCTTVFLSQLRVRKHCRVARSATCLRRCSAVRAVRGMRVSDARPSDVLQL
jgi:hypothetical protein